MTDAPSSLKLRDARKTDLGTIREIYNQGVVDRIATLDEGAKSDADILEWSGQHDDRYAVVVALRGANVVGWASRRLYVQLAAAVLRLDA